MKQQYDEPPSLQDLNDLHQELEAGFEGQIPIFMMQPDRISLSDSELSSRVANEVDAYQTPQYNVIRYPKAISKAIKRKFP